MKILHIVGQFEQTKVYANIFEQLGKMGYDQEVYIAKRKKNYSSAEKFLDSIKSKNVNSNVCYSLRKTYGDIDRILYYPRIKKTYSDLKKCVDMAKIDIMYAHTFFTDGMLAYMLKKEYNKEYVVVVRSMDAIHYMNKMIHTRPVINKIASEAKHIIFVSEAIKQKLYSKLSPKLIEIFEKKAVVIPNAIDDFWYTNTSKHAPNGKEIQMIQVSNFTKTKRNIDAIKLCKYMNENNIPTKLTFAGTGKYEDMCKRYVMRHKLGDLVIFTGYIQDRDIIKNMYANAGIYIMMSSIETFGLTYMEAMANGLPIIYTKGMGVDGMFKLKVGYAVDICKDSFAKISKEIIDIMNDYEQISNNARIEAKQSKWDNVIQKMDNILR